VSASKTITATDPNDRRDIPFGIITSGVATAMNGAKLINSPLPGTAKHELCELIPPHLRDGLRERQDFMTIATSMWSPNSSKHFESL
tara:strand:- start:222 stop:482 length:261 start_codon:yes stop_codon:yes gene_type:complete